MEKFFSTSFRQIFGGTLFDVISRIAGIIQMLVPILISLAVLYFLWGVKNYVTASDGEDQTEARHMIVNGTIILFSMVAVWGLVNLIIASTGVGPTTVPIYKIKV